MAIQDPALGKPVPFPMVLTPADIDKALTNREVRARVEGKILAFQTIDISQVMKYLTNVGQVLNLAYSGSFGLPCRVKIAAMLINYQSLVGDSVITTSSFVTTSLAALKLHNLSLAILNKNCENADQINTNCEKTVQILLKCANLAQQMAVRSKFLVEKSNDMCRQASDALLEATKDEVMTSTERNTNLNLIAELKVKETTLTRVTKDLTTDIEEARENEKQAAQEAKEAQAAALVLGVISNLNTSYMFKKKIEMARENTTVTVASVTTEVASSYMSYKKDEKNMDSIKILEQTLAEKEKELKQLGEQGTVGTSKDDEKRATLQQEIINLKNDILKIARDSSVEASTNLNSMSLNFLKLSKEYREKERIAANARIELQKELRNANKDLVEAVEKLKSQKAVSNDIEKTLNALNITTISLGKIRTVFENTRIYWLSVEAQCLALADMNLIEALADPSLKELLESEIMDSGFNWLSLAKTNQLAHTSMLKVKDGVDGVLNNLPTREGGLLLIDELADNILVEVENENKLLKE